MTGYKDINPAKVAVYIRWSTDDQGEGTTLETQLERCKYFLASQGWQFNENLVYIDDGYSGGSLDRPAMTKLRKDVDKHLVDCVVSYRIDRLSRSVVDIVDLVLREWEGRCFVKSASEDVNTLSPAGKMFFYMLVSFAEYERNVIKERTMNGKIKRAEQGLNPGFRPPYGYTKGDAPGKFRVVEHEAAIVRRMYDLYLKGNGVYLIACALNAEGLQHRGRPWGQLLIRKILSNPTYIGRLEYGRYERVSKQQRERLGLAKYVRYEKPRFAVVEGAVEAIVDRKVWEDAQKLIEARSTKHKEAMARSGKPTYSEYLLSGVAVCRCGAILNGKTAGGHAYYYCSARKDLGPSVCNSGYVAAAEVNAQIEKRVKGLLTVEGKKAMLKAIESDLEAKANEMQGALEEHEAQLRAIRDRAGRIEQDYRDGDLPAKLYAKEIEAVEKEAQGVEARKEGLKAALEELDEVRRNRDELLSTVDSVSLWDTLNVPERRQLLQKLTARIVLYREVHSHESPILELEWIRL